MNGKWSNRIHTYTHLPRASTHPPSSVLGVLPNTASSGSKPVTDPCTGGVGRSGVDAGRARIPSPSPPTSVRYVSNVSDVNFSDSMAEVREINLDGENSATRRQFAQKQRRNRHY